MASVTREIIIDAAPDDVDFDSEVVIFFSAGVKPTGGYTASIVKVVQLGRTLAIATQLEIPGAGCATTDALTTPYALVTVSPTRAIRPRPSNGIARPPLAVRRTQPTGWR